MTKQIQLSQGKAALVDDDMYEYLNQWKWCVASNKGWRVVRNVWDAEVKKSKTIYMHRIVVNAPNGMMVDHINGDSLDNRRSNLRVCNHTENNRNRSANKTNKSGFKGVAWIPSKNKFRVSIKENGNTHYIGMFRTPEEAARAYDKAAKEFFGEFARTNF